MIRDHSKRMKAEEDYLAVLAKYNLSASDLPPWGSQKRAKAEAMGQEFGFDYSQMIQRHSKRIQNEEELLGSFRQNII